MVESIYKQNVISEVGPGYSNRKLRIPRHARTSGVACHWAHNLLLKTKSETCFCRTERLIMPAEILIDQFGRMRIGILGRGESFEE